MLIILILIFEKSISKSIILKLSLEILKNERENESRVINPVTVTGLMTRDLCLSSYFLLFAFNFLRLFRLR